MSQYDFGTIDPNTKSGTALATDLNSWRNALHSTHGGSSAPSYITAGMLWLDTTSANYKLKLYDGAQSIDVGIIDATNNVARVAVDSAATSYITATTAAQIKFVIASVDTATIRSTGLQFNIASPYIGDSSNNELLSFSTTASAVNQINVANAATGTNPVISAIGNDTNIGITLTPKGTGRTNIGQLALDGTTITTSAAELNYVDGVTSAIQTQLDAKAPSTSPTLTNPIISGNLGAGGANYGTSGQVLTSGGAGASTSWSTIATGGMTLLGTLATTSGTSVTLSGLTLTSYKFLQIVINGFSCSNSNSSGYPGNMRLNGWDIALTNNVAATAKGGSTVDLTTGIFWGVTQTAIGGAANTPALAGLSGLTTASTSITFTAFSDYGGAAFDAGSITVYGVK